MDKNDGGPAFPVSEEEARGKVSGVYGGMSLRDYFAAKAMQSQIIFDGTEGCDKFLLCGMAYELADAMLNARES